MALEELDHLIELSASPQDSVSRYYGVDAVNDRISEWFQTPMGTVADYPSWGNTLAGLQHEPISETLEVLIKAKILNKLARDCRLRIQGIRVEFVDIDMIDVKILHQYGIFDDEVKRAV